LGEASVMVYVIVAILLIVVAVAIYGAVMRRKIYQEIDRYESWKIDVMNRPIAEQIAKVKELKMVGETEKKFESWRRDWDEIVTTDLPAVEEKLFDAEDYADKFRFGKAQEVVIDIQRSLEAVEAKLKRMLDDLNEVIESEEENRKDIVTVKEKYHGLKKDLIAKRPLYKRTAPFVEAELSNIESDLARFEEEREAGNVLKAREILGGVKERLDELAGIMGKIPKFYRDIHDRLPKQLDELENGVAEMAAEGYALSHLKIDERIKDMRKQLTACEDGLEKAAFDEVERVIADLNEQLEWLYNQLEKEVESRKQLREEVPIVRRDLEIVAEKVKEIARETELVKESYRIEPGDLRTQQDIDEAFEKLRKEFDEVSAVLSENKQAFSIIYEKIEDMRHHIERLRDNADEFKEFLTNLRKDELIAKETLQKLKERLFKARRKVQKSNLPGIPASYITLVDDAEEVLNEISIKLDVKPLEMHAIQQLLEDAHEKVRLVYEKTDEMVESAILTEQLIQYGNRYRSRDPELHQALLQAEDYFRSYNYAEAVEIAAAAIYRIDPSVVKRFKVEVEDVV